jgi:hypothetical protein
MPIAARPPDGQLFGELLEVLRRDLQIPTGADHYLRLERLLSRIDGSCSLEDLKTLLCPLFATTPRQQDAFYRVFDAWYPRFSQDAIPARDVRDANAAIVRQRPTPLRAKWWPYALTALLVVVVGVSLFQWGLAPVAPTDQGTVLPPSEPPVTRPEPSTLPPGFGAPATLTFFQQHWFEIRMASVLTPWILLAAYGFYRRNRSQVFFQRQHATQPPYVLELRVDNAPLTVGDPQDFFVATRRLRTRQAGEGRRFDVRKTIRSTIAALGYSRFEFSQHTKIPEYVVLIDRVSAHDHHARYADRLIDQLASEGVFIVRYFYDADPRVCWSDADSEAVSIDHVSDRYGAHRLLVIGDGYGLLDPVTGAFLDWGSDLERWCDRALLTPVPPVSWGAREVALTTSFVVVPATALGLMSLVNYFDRTQEHDLRWWQRSTEPALPDLTGRDPLPGLRDYLGPEGFRWLSACAIYPELQWDLTLHVGSLPCTGGSVIDEANFLKLIRLPWFRVGLIPDDVRFRLMTALDPESERTVRSSLMQLLDREPLPSGSVGEEARQLQVAIQKAWIARTSRRQLSGALQRLEEFAPSVVLKDIAAVRLLETAFGAKHAARLPRTLRRGLFRNGFPGLGLRTLVRFGGALLLAAIVATSAWFGIQPAAGSYAVLIALGPDPTNEQGGESVLPTKEIDEIGNTGLRLLRGWATAPRRIFAFVDLPNATEITDEVQDWQNSRMSPSDFLVVAGSSRARRTGNFVRVLIEGLQGSADANKNRLVAVDEFTQYVTRTIEAAPSPQQPMWATNLPGSFSVSDLSKPGLSPDGVSRLADSKPELPAGTQNSSTASTSASLSAPVVKLRLGLKALASRIVPRNRVWTVSVLVAVLNERREGVRVPSDVTVHLTAVLGTVTPGQVVIRQGESAAFVEVVSQRQGRDTISARSSSASGAEETIDYEPSRASKLLILSTPSTVVISGRNQSSITVLLRDDDDHVVSAADDIQVAMRATGGTLSQRGTPTSVVVIPRGRPDSESLLLSSGRPGTAIVTADAIGLQGDSTAIRFVLSWLLIALATVGGAVGAVFSAPRGKRKTGAVRSLAVGMVVGALVFALVLAGISGLIPAVPVAMLEGLTLNELAGFIIGFFAGYLSRPLMDAVLRQVAGSTAA